MWTRRRSFPGEVENDWCVYRDGQLVGRVYMLTRYLPRSEVWGWFKQVPPGTSGDAETLDEALNALRDAILAADEEKARRLGQGLR
ncbi:hypothetical protein SAMN05421849_0196 [Pontibaca methylaminivorans]|uniref:Uncharacterized protein n=2 Tax=Pontibaca methylaminivorans TaxID=515897 RepID=A0A1R3WCA3_9RHOB|nr:hypothetical protein SAMN05421849_0196 [Pontibaca methylaminivorans]